MDQDTTQAIELDGWRLRIRLPSDPAPHPVMLLLHGWTGDEGAMWIFASRLPKNALLIAPRGLFPSSRGGYGWYPIKGRAWPWMADFQQALDRLAGLLSQEHFPSADMSALRLVGFSQGAALAFAFALTYPERVASLAALSGFMPEGATILVKHQPLFNKPIFIAHGIRDELVPVERAREAVRLLQEAGAQVHYCEHDVGHKLSADCFRAMQHFFERF